MLESFFNKAAGLKACNFIKKKTSAQAQGFPLNFAKLLRITVLRNIFFKIGIHSVQGLTATTRHGVTRKRRTKRLKHTEDLFIKNLQLKGVC